MPVQVPELKRLDTPDAISTGRISDNAVPNFVSPVEKTSNAIEKVGEKVKSFAEEQEDHAISTKADDLANQYEQKFKAGLGDARKNEGDPTEAYQKLREDSAKWQNDTLENLPQNAVDPAANRLAITVRDRMSKINYRLSDTAAMAEATQAAAYRDKVFRAGVELDQNYIGTDATSLVHKEDKSSTSYIAAGLNQLEGRHLQNAIANGLIKETTNEDGTKSYTQNPIVTEGIKKDTSAALLTSIRSLNASGLVDESKMVMDRFGDQLSAADRLKLQNETKGAQTDVEASKIWAKYQNDDSWFEKISADNKLDPQVKERALQKGDNYHRIMDHNSKRAADASYSDAAGYIRDMADQGTPILTLDQLRNDKNLAGLRDRMAGKPKLWDAIEQQIIQPKVSDPKALGKFYNAVADGSIRNMSSQDVAAMTVGLDAKHQRVVENEFKASQESNGEHNAIMKNVMSLAKQNLFQAGVINPASFNNKYDAKYKDSQVEFAQFMDRVYENSNSLPKNATPEVQNKWVKQVVGKYIKDKNFSPGSIQAPQEAVLRSAPRPPPYQAPVTQQSSPATVSGQTASASYTDKQILDAVAKYNAATGKAWSRKNGNTVKDLAPYLPKGQ